MLAIATSDDGGGEGMASGFFSISNEGLFNVTAILAVVLLGVALAQAGSSGGGGAMVGGLAGVGVAGAGPAAQWAADPFARHQMRYFNGSEWTATVSDHGVVGTDPATYATAAPAQLPAAAPLPAPGAAMPPEPPSPFAPAPASPFAPEPPSPFAPERPSPFAPAADTARWCPNGHSNAATARFAPMQGHRWRSSGSAFGATLTKLT